MKRYLRILNILALVMFGFIAAGCVQDEPANPDGDPTDQTPEDPDGLLPGEDIFGNSSTILLYAVASNNLQPALFSDIEEMRIAGAGIDLKANNILLYKSIKEYDENNYYTGNAVATLEKLVKRGSEVKWVTIEEFSQDTPSLDPQRIKEVFDKVFITNPAQINGMIFWSHSSGADPYLESRSQVQLPMAYSFGIDETEDRQKYYAINVDELADALPDNFLDFIWFDSCYMSNIESMYQFRNKCKYYVGYATEVYSPGMPYHLTLPHLVAPNIDLKSAAKEFFDFYDITFYQQTGYRAATIAIADMDKITALAEYCRNVYTPINTDSYFSFIKYTRGSIGPFYDLGDYTKDLASKGGKEISTEEWDAILNDCIIYKAATPKDFNRNEIYPERFSGISTHIYKFDNTNTSTENFYRNLDWFKTVF